MAKATQNALSKTYISQFIKLDYFNNSNLKTDIQNRISNDIENQFDKALQNIKGDTLSGYSFSEVTLLAMAYFFEKIFDDKIKDAYYSLEMVKGFFDANNPTNYTAIHEIDVVFCNLKSANLDHACWLIIQCAWFFNSEHFGHHQQIDFVNHFIETGETLPIENYRFDKDYLQKKYNEVATQKEKQIPINGFSLVEKWYFGILFVVCNELGLPTTNFKTKEIDNRIYNPLTKTSRQLRSLTPFKIIECDIKSAFPTFIDIEAKATIKDEVYNNLMRSKNITRPEAKILFNKICNSGAYKTKEFTKRFLIDCGYTETQSNSILELTHSHDRKFISSMTEYEALAILHFVNSNGLQRATRLHDALYYIDKKQSKPALNGISPNCEFGYKEINRPTIKHSYSIGSKFNNNAYINSLPKETAFAKRYDPAKPEIKGVSNGFRFYISKFKYIDAGFDLTATNIDFNEFTSRCITMINTLYLLNKKPLKAEYLLIIIRHIRQKSNFIFNVRAMYYLLIKNKFDATDIFIKERDSDLVKPQTFKTKNDYIVARQKALKNVNTYNNLNDLKAIINERIKNNDFEYLDEVKVTGRKENNALSIAIIRLFNLLCTGRFKKQRKKDTGNNLYITILKVVTGNSISSTQKANEKRSKNKALRLKKEQKNRQKTIEKAKQLIFVVNNGFETPNLKRNETHIRELKTELYNMIFKTEIKNNQKGSDFFDTEFLKSNEPSELKPNTDLENIFNTNMANSIFNQLDVEKANSKGEKFFNEYLKFHECEIVKEQMQQH